MKFFKIAFATMVGFFLTLVVFFLLALVIVGGLVSSMDDKQEVEVKPNSLLHVKFDGAIVDRAAKDPFSEIDFGPIQSEKKMGLNDILSNIEKAKTDDNIKGIYMDISSVPAGLASVEEIRNALLDFKTSEKFIVSYSEIYSQTGYYLASVADEIWLNPAGMLEWKGLGAQLMFFKGALEKLQVEPQVIRYGKFKSAIEPFINDKMSEANREQTEKYMGSLWNQFLENIAESRGLTAEQLDGFAEKGTIQNAQDAVDNKLADKLYYKDEVIAELKKRTETDEDDDLESVSLSKYTDAPAAEKKKFSKKKVAVIYATGSIEGGNGDNETIGSERISKAIRKARLDTNVKAVVLRVNSPGGSALASDVMWREVVLTSDVKPIVASMGDVAASGGYYISCAADTILASPNTITGSIGVFGLLFNAQALLNEKLGITIDTVKTNKFADLGTVFRALTPEERALIQNGVNEIYDDFITKVADGRGMTKDQIDSIGQGRVWSGEDALDLGLVDIMGGLDDAIEVAAGMADLEEYRVVDYPEQKDPFQAMVEKLTGKGEQTMLKAQLGEHYKYYSTLREMSKMKGVQMRLPFVYHIE